MFLSVCLCSNCQRPTKTASGWDKCAQYDVILQGMKPPSDSPPRTPILPPPHAPPVTLASLHPPSAHTYTHTVYPHLRFYTQDSQLLTYTCMPLPITHTHPQEIHLIPPRLIHLHISTYHMYTNIGYTSYLQLNIYIPDTCIYARLHFMTAKCSFLKWLPSGLLTKALKRCEVQNTWKIAVCATSHVRALSLFRTGLSRYGTSFLP